MDSISIDINCDMGESVGSFQIGNNEALMPLVSSANIACGFHGGDPRTIDRTIALAIEHEVQIGAHPSSYWDLHGFGRRTIAVPIDELSSILKYQIGAVMGLAHAQGGKVSYVKPHGALYHQIQNDRSVASCFVESVQSMDPNLKILAAANQTLSGLCRDRRVKLISEGFADRRYGNTGQLVSRNVAGSVISDPDEAATQAIQLAFATPVQTADGSSLVVPCQSICLHGDHPNSAEVGQAIVSRLSTSNVAIRSF